MYKMTVGGSRRQRFPCLLNQLIA